MWFVEGKTFEEAADLNAKKQSERIAQLEAEIADLQKRLSGALAASGEANPVDFQSGEIADAKHKGLASKIRFAGEVQR